MFILLVLLTVQLWAHFRKQIEQERKKNLQAILDAHESERKTIAREIHDNLGPLLSISILQADALLEKEIPAGQRELMKHIKKQLSDALYICRQVSHELTPLLHTGITLKEVVSGYMAQINAAGKLQILLQYEAEGVTIQEKKATSLCRVVAELLHNTVKHAHATEARIHVYEQNAYFVMDYSDNGEGMPRNKKVTGIGMNNIYSRISLLNGSISLPDATTRGFKILIKIPARALQ